jgi:hypothetical protein
VLTLDYIVVKSKCLEYLLLLLHPTHDLYFKESQRYLRYFSGTPKLYQNDLAIKDLQT